ncbi:MAG: hypothetical protein R3F38_14160 [Gammaproteobacteria bacterium]
MSLTHEEKDELYGVIEIMFGYDSQLESLKPNYTEETVEVVESALEALIMQRQHEGACCGLAGWSTLPGERLAQENSVGKPKKRLDSARSSSMVSDAETSLYNWKSAIVISAY